MRSNSARRSKIGGQRAGGFAGAHHVDVQFGEVLGVRGQAVGQRSAALEHAQDVEHDEAEGGSLGELGGDGEGAIERHAGVEQRGQLLGEEEDVAAAASAEGGQLELDAGVSSARRRRRPASGPACAVRGRRAFRLAGEAAGAHLAVGGDGAEEEGRHQWLRQVGRCHDNLLDYRVKHASVAPS